MRKNGREGSYGVQQCLSVSLHNQGFIIKTEYPLQVLYEGRYRLLRADVAVIDGRGIPVFLFECKDTDRDDATLRWVGTRQYQKYKNSGTPFCICLNRADIPSCIRLMKSVLGLKGEL